MITRDPVSHIERWGSVFFHPCCHDLTITCDTLLLKTKEGYHGTTQIIS